VRIVKEEKPMIRCSDVMKPIEAPSRGLRQDSANVPHKRCVIQALPVQLVVEDREHIKQVGGVTERNVLGS